MPVVSEAATPNSRFAGQYSSLPKIMTAMAERPRVEIPVFDFRSKGA
jgi:hypothetical protein